MPTLQTESLATLYEQDETAWLEIMANLVAQKKFKELDHRHLSEYLSDMAKRDRREVHSRLVQLLLHMLKWKYQPENRTTSWENSIDDQRLELNLLLDSGTLLNHATEILDEVYASARKRAAKQTQIRINKFPKDCPWSLDDILRDD